MNPLIRFYLGEGPDSEGRFLRDIRSWDARRLESVHDYIQWLFPLRTFSRFNPDAPILDDEIVGRFLADEPLRAELLASFRQMLAFYGFDYREESGRPIVALAPDAAARQRTWLNPGNHNLLRITRILSCLSTLGLRPQAEAFFAALEGIYAQHGPVIGMRTMGFWRDAVAQDSLLENRPAVMLPGHDPTLPPDDAEDEAPAEPASVLCPHCAASNLPAADFCARCGAPLSVIASTDPLRSTLSEGFLYREATRGEPKRIVVVGIWLIFLPGLASLPLAWSNGETGPHRLATQGLWSLLSAVIPMLTTMNYARKRSAQRAGCDEETPQA